MSLTEAVHQLHAAPVSELVGMLTRVEHQAGLIRSVIRERRRAEAEERVAPPRDTAPEAEAR